MNELAFPKPVRIEDPLYLKWITEQDCVCDGPECIGDVTYHHIKARGMGTKCSDHKVVPMCMFGHHTGGNNSIHIRGWKAFEKRYGIDLIELAAFYRRKYLEEVGQ